MKPFGRDPELLVKRIVSWIQSELRRANAKNAVFGLSGGFDSVHDDPPDRKHRSLLKRCAFFFRTPTRRIPAVCAIDPE